MKKLFQQLSIEEQKRLRNKMREVRRQTEEITGSWYKRNIQGEGWSERVIRARERYGNG